MKKILTVFLILLSSIFVVNGLAFADHTQICNEKSTLAWELNSEADMDHYKVYHNANNITAKDDVGIASFIVTHDPTLAVDGKVVEQFPQLPEGARHFRVTAVDTSGNESGLSNETGCVIDFSPTTPVIELRFGPQS